MRPNIRIVGAITLFLMLIGILLGWRGPGLLLKSIGALLFIGALIYLTVTLLSGSYTRKR
jgi:Zn-dependent membrane protease YugP